MYFFPPCLIVFVVVVFVPVFHLLFCTFVNNAQLCVPGKVFREHSKLLSKFKGIQSKNLAVQLLPKPEQLGPNDILFFVQHRDIQTQNNTPDWPPHEIIFPAGSKPKLEGLHNVLVAQSESLVGPAVMHGIAEADNLVVAKWYPKQLVWRRLQKGGKQSGRGRKGGRKRKGRQIGNLKSTFQLQDGNLLAFVDTRTLGSTTVENIVWEREEDQIAMQYKQMAAIEKSQKKVKGGSSSVKTTKRAAPVGDAKIHVYLGFSSSDEDVDEGEEECA